MRKPRKETQYRVTTNGLGTWKIELLHPGWFRRWEPYIKHIVKGYAFYLQSTWSTEQEARAEIARLIVENRVANTPFLPVSDVPDSLILEAERYLQELKDAKDAD